jgi:hypothetical protein
MYGLLTFDDDYFIKSVQDVAKAANKNMTELHMQALQEQVCTSSPLS